MAKEYFELFSIRNFKHDGDEKTVWTRIGTAFQNDDKSYNLLLDLIPCSNPKTGNVQLHMRLPRTKEEKTTSENIINENSACVASQYEINEDIL